jgi:hypothetical protein
MQIHYIELTHLVDIFIRKTFKNIVNCLLRALALISCCTDDIDVTTFVILLYIVMT